MHGTQCRDCYNQQHPPHPVAAPAAAASPPPPLFPSHAGNHAPLPVVQRAAVVTLVKDGQPRGVVAAKVGTSVPAVRRWVQRYEQHGDVADEPRSGRPHATDEATDINIAVMARVEPHQSTPKQVKHKLDLDVSARTVRRRLDEAGLFGRVEREEHELSDYELEAAIAKEWQAVDPEYLTSLMESMPERLAEVIANNGHKTHY